MSTSSGILRIAAGVACVVTCLYASTLQLHGADFWLLAKIGEIIADQHAIPDTVLFPFTEIASEKFNAHEWLACLFFHYALKWIGEQWMPLLVGALGLTLFVSSSRLAYIRGHSNLAVALLGGLCALITENYRHSLRPELLALNIMVVFWIGLEQFRNKPDIESALLVWVTGVLWVNCHGSFILAPILVAIYTTGTYLQQMVDTKTWLVKPSGQVYALALLAALVCLSCLINPFGWELIEFVFKFSGDPRLYGAIIEWFPTTHFLGERWLWIIGSIWLLVLLVVVKNFRKIHMVDALVFAAFTALAFKAIRFPIYIGVMAAFVIPAYIPAQWNAPQRQKYLYGVVIATALSLLTLAATFGNLSSVHPYSLGAWKLSKKMVNVLRNPAMHGNVYTSMEMGSELIYLAYPRLKPSMDARIDSYGFDYYQYQKALLFDDKLLEEFVHRYDVKYMLLKHDAMNQFIHLDAWKSGTWQDVMTDSFAVLLKRSDVSPQEVTPIQ